ncbi:MAG TPA: hypothetical protein VG406_14950 [Isosphaeraceae bacterium]|nr:hypothetical protein [Isosphaeraceae bacterium]
MTHPFAPLALLRYFARPRTTTPRRRRADRGRVRPQLEGLEGRRLLSGVSGTAAYPIPSGFAAWYIAAGPDGNLWFTEGYTPGSSGKVGVVNPANGAIQEFNTPTASSAPREITAAPDGNVWFTEFSGGKLGMINPTTHAITEVSLPANYVQPWGIAAGPDGNLWFTAIDDVNGTLYGAIGTYNLTTHAFSMSTAPGTYQLRGIAKGPDGNLWFADYSRNKVGAINPTTHVITEFATPTGQSAPFEVAAGPDGNVWFTETGAGKVGAINPTTDAISEFALPNPSYAYGITAGPDGNLWAVDGQLARINPATNALTQSPVAATRGIAIGPDGNLWLASGSSITVATLSPSETDLVVTQQPPTSVTAGAGFGLTVAVEDGSGNVDPSFQGAVTLALGNNPGGATLGGTLTATAVNGVATFSGLSLTKAAAGYTLVASSGLSGEGFSGALSVTPAAATQLVILQQPPSSVGVNKTFGLQAAIEDQYGNIVTSANNSVTIVLATNPGGATLGGTTTVAAVDGIVTFSNLTLNKKGKGYTLRLSSAGLTSVTTSAITVG